MNRRLSLPLSLLIGMVFALPLHGQAPGAAIPSNVKEETDVVRHRPIVEQFVRHHLEQLQQMENPQAQAAARDALVNETMHNGQPAPPAFLDLYANILNQELENQIAGHPVMRVRLLGAIVAARVADRAGNTRLAGVAPRFIADDSQAVVLWGVKTARGVMPAVMANPMMRENGTLAEAVVAAVERFPNGPIAQEAYETFIMDLLDRGRVDAAIVRHSVAPLHRVFSIRMEQYRAGDVEEPMVENRATLFLTASRIWGAQTAAQQTQTVQLTSDLLWLSAHLAASEPAKRERLVHVIRQSGRAIYVLAQPRNDQRLLQLLERANAMPVNAPPDELRQVADDVHSAVRGVFSGVAAPQAAANGAAVMN